MPLETNYQVKEQPVTNTPLLLFDCLLNNGTVERWSTHRASVAGHTYEARVLRHNLFEMQTASDQGVDGIPKISIALANADSHFSEVERSVAWKGSKLTATFLFYDLRSGAPTTAGMVVFQGITNPPEEMTESLFRLTAINRMSMQRVLLPPVRIQRRCPWEFPTKANQRIEAADGGTKGRYSRFFRCGYSPDAPGGSGTLNGAVPFTSCGYTRSDCEARGMFRQDSSARPTRRFGGIEFVPSSILVRSYGEKDWQTSPVADNEARYNDFVPLVYGTAWYAPPVVFARNDGNLTHLEVLLGMGDIQGVLKVLVHDIEIPLGEAGRNMTGTGWYNVPSLGNRTGGFNLDFTDAAGNPPGDPYGSMAFLSLVVPNRINDGKSLPRVQVLVQGMKLPQYTADGSYAGDQFTNNPAWILLDILQRSGWSLDEIDAASFAATAEYCSEEISVNDLYGNTIMLPRFQCNLVLRKRRTAADIIRGIRNGSRLYLTYGNGGRLQLRVENNLALQQPEKLAWSNSGQILDGGWPSYEFSDGSDGYSGILRKANGEASIRVWSRSTIDTPNRFAVEFQDALNAYQQDSFSLVDVEDVERAGQEITGALTVLGIPNYDQAARITKFHLDRSIQGNTYVEFETSVKAFGLRPGDLISVTYLKEGFERQPFRIAKIAPGMNYRTAMITAQIHKDDWYSDTNGQAGGDGGGWRPGSGLGLPRPLIGSVTDADGDIQFDIAESTLSGSDGSIAVQINVGFIAPHGPQAGGPRIPLLSLAPTVSSDGGTLAGDETLYYAMAAVDVAAQESRLSFIVRAVIPPGTSTHTVTLSGLSFAPEVTGFHVYRGVNPAQLFRIASDQPVSATFTDSGLAKQLTAPADPNYEHANFYWRLELQPEYAATLHTSTSIGNSALQMPVNSYRGMAVRITRGKGAGQERSVSSNTETVLALTSKWDIEPDATSSFVIAEAGWHFGAATKTSPVQFEIPNRTGAVVQIVGRAANVNDQEPPYELSTVTRWVVGGAGGGDTDVPPAPVFALELSPGRPGTLEFGGIAFTDLTNTHTVTAGNLTMYYWDELRGLPVHVVTTAIGPADTLLDLNLAGTAAPGSLVQVEDEIMRVDEVLSAGSTYRLSRGIHHSVAAAHAVSVSVYHLQQRVIIVPFARAFFGSPYSGNWSYPIHLPNVRLASAELFLINSAGNGAVGSISVTQTTDSGLRTLSGGQYSMQIDGFLAVETGAAPDLMVEAPHAVRDVFAIVKQAPAGAPIQLQLKYNGAAYCGLTIPAGSTVSNTVKGLGLRFVDENGRISLDVTDVGTSSPGSDLSVIIRL
jgi:hypothetical protein